MRTPVTAILVAATIGVGALAMACSTTSQGASSGGNNADTPTQASQPAAVADHAAPAAPLAVAATPTSVPVAVPTPAPAPTDVPVAPAPPADAAPPPPPPPPPAAGAITLDMADNSFATSQLTVAAGTPITVTVNNAGKNMHNFDVQGVAKTPLQPSGQSQVVTFTVQPGAYTFVCDVHPKEMVGTLVAQ